ncbi:hypothetical protein [Endozoicomonas acroporae]
MIYPESLASIANIELATCCYGALVDSEYPHTANKGVSNHLENMGYLG